MDRIHDAGRPLDALCDEIVNRYHGPLHRLLPAIGGEIAHVAALAPSPALDRMRVAYDDLASQIRNHLAKEENLLFPALAALWDAERDGTGRPALPFVTVLHPIRLMEAEHVRIEATLDHLRELALIVDDAGGVQAWHRCMTDLAQLDADLRAHHRLENEVLFPGALELERRLL